MLYVKNLALGYEAGVVGEAVIFGGVTAEISKQSLLFLGNDYAAYWYDYITIGGGLAAQTGGALSGGVESGLFLAVNLNPRTNNPQGYQGISIKGTVSIGVEALAVGLSSSASIAASWDDTWITIGLGRGASIGPQLGIFETGYLGGSLTATGTYLANPNNVIPTRDRSYLDIIKNWTWDRFH